MRTLLISCAVLLGTAAMFNAPGTRIQASPDADNPTTTLTRQTGDLLREACAAFGLDDGTLLHLAPRGQGEASCTIPIVLDGDTYTLALGRHSVRSPRYTVLHQGADGALVEVVPGPVNTYRGSTLEIPEADVRLSFIGSEISAVIDFGEGDSFWIEPLSRHLDHAPRGLHIVYHQDDNPGCGGTCGITAEFLNAHPSMADAGAGDGSFIPTGNTVWISEVAIDCDYHYYQDWGGNTESHVNSLFNAINGVYDEVSIDQQIGTIIIRTSSGSNPYTTNSATQLLDQFQNHWNSNHGNIQRDLAHLLTGRNLSGGTLGIAYVGVVCNTSYAYGLVMNQNNYNCDADTTTHEIGHNFNADHCNCPSNTMNAYQQSCPLNFHNTYTVPVIVAFRNSSSCLTQSDGTSGACCFSNGFCIFTSEDTCDTNGGTFEGEGISCSSVECEVNEDGACCFTGGTCVDGYDQSTCVSLGGTYAGDNTACSSFDCSSLTGACCFSSGSCAVLDETTCSVAGGSYQGDGGDCASANCPAPAPDNDDCDDAIQVTAGATTFTTNGATTDGPDEYEVCNSGGYTQIDNDIWFRFTAPADGTLVASTCGSSFNTKMALYLDICPDFPSTYIVQCDDNSCGQQSLVTSAMTEGLTMRIRVGGRNGAMGDGVLTIDFSEDETCPEDIDGSGATDFGDILAILSAWGACGSPCPEDIDQSGDVDFGDILAVLSAWGEC